jgi:4-carboxymuconolactone decarboxylase
VYSANYERLRANIRMLHPALDAWMITEGYGRTMGRPGLDLARRELAVVAQVAVQGAERQLHSHLKGSLNAGVTPEVLEECLEILIPVLGVRERSLVNTLWARIRSS